MCLMEPCKVIMGLIGRSGVCERTMKKSKWVLLMAERHMDLASLHLLNKRAGYTRQDCTSKFACCGSTLDR